MCDCGKSDNEFNNQQSTIAIDLQEDRVVVDDAVDFGVQCRKLRRRKARVHRAQQRRNARRQSLRMARPIVDATPTTQRARTRTNLAQLIQDCQRVLETEHIAHLARSDQNNFVGQPPLPRPFGHTLRSLVRSLFLRGTRVKCAQSGSMSSS